MSESWKDLLTSDAFKKRGRIVYRVKISEEVRYASSDGNHAYLKELLSTGMVDPNYEDNWLVTPLNAAIRGGHLKVANLLLEAGADPDIANKYGITPLMIAVYGGYSSCVKVLLNKGANPDKVQKNSGYTALYYSAWLGEKDSVQLLLDAGADPEKKDRWGSTPLRKALSSGSKHKDEVVYILQAYRKV